MFVRRMTMTDLFEKSIQILELPRVLELLAEQAVTQEGKERSVQLRPFTEIDDVARAQAETTAAVKMLTLYGTPALSGVRPVGPSLQRADMGGSRTPESFWKLPVYCVPREVSRSTEEAVGRKKAVSTTCSARCRQTDIWKRKLQVLL